MAFTSDKKYIVSVLESIIDKPETTEQERGALKEACSIIKAKGAAGYLEALRWIRVALGLWDDFQH